MRAAILAACLMTTGSLPVATARWSDPATWGGTVPTSGPVVIPVGQTVLLDVSTASLGALTINGTLLADPSVDVGITADNIVIGAAGTLQVGSESQRYARNCTITLTGAEAGRAARFVPVHDNPVTGKGKPARLAVGTGVVSGEIITLTFTSATAFTASSSTAGAMPSGTVGAYYSSRVQFMPTAGSTAWVAGDTVVISVGAQMGFSNNGVGRSLVVQPGGKLELWGFEKTGFAVVADSVASGAQSVPLTSFPVGWRQGDRVVFAAVDFHETAAGTPHVSTLSAEPTGALCALTDPTTVARFSKLQYATDTGVSLTPGSFTLAGMKRYADTPEVLDQRGRVLNLSRSIVVQGIDDASWQTSRFGAHCMFMGLASQVRLVGVEFRRVGQAGAIGRYPIHWHMPSYGGQQGGNMNLPSDGSFLGKYAAGSALIRGCSIHQSAQRGTVLHGAWGVEVRDNVYHDITAHCIFLEDNAEEENTIVNNTIVETKNPLPANRLTESDQVGEPGWDALAYDHPNLIALNNAAGIWFSNPRNVLEDNWVCRAFGVGIWNAFAAKKIGLCIEVSGAPDKTPLLSHKRNFGVGCRIHGMMTAFGATNSRGSLIVTRFTPATATQEAPFEEVHLYKNGRGGYQNQVFRPVYKNWRVADNRGMDLFGAITMVSEVTGLFVGTSLNAANPPREDGPYGPRASMASYHFLLLPGGSYFDYPAKTSTVRVDNIVRSMYSTGGILRTSDFYLEGMEGAMGNMTSIPKMYNTGFFRLEKDAIDGGHPADSDGRINSQAFWDRLGVYGHPDWYVVLDTAFATTGLSGASISLPSTNAWVTPDRYASMSAIAWSDDWTLANTNLPGYTYQRRGMTMHRLDSGYVSVATLTSDPVPANQAGAVNFAIKDGQRYRAQYNSGSLPTSWASFGIGYLLRSGMTAIVGIPWGGASFSGGYQTTQLAGVSTGAYGFAVPDVATLPTSHITEGVGKNLTVVGSLAALEAAASCAAYFDATAQVIWVKFLAADWPTSRYLNPNSSTPDNGLILTRLNA
jgi:hypothetical protein